MMDDVYALSLIGQLSCTIDTFRIPPLMRRYTCLHLLVKCYFFEIMRERYSVLTAKALSPLRIPASACGRGKENMLRKVKEFLKKPSNCTSLVTVLAAGITTILTIIDDQYSAKAISVVLTLLAIEFFTLTVLVFENMSAKSLFNISATAKK